LKNLLESFKSNKYYSICQFVVLIRQTWSFLPLYNRSWIVCIFYNI